MTKEERNKYFKFYRGEERCPFDWCGEPQGVIWGAERSAEQNWDALVSGEWGTKDTLEGRLEEFIESEVGTFDPFDAESDMEFYFKTKGREFD